jgi:hypothetical protein
MKKTILASMLAILIQTSCQKDESNPETPKGSLAINIGLFISVGEVDNNLKSTWDAEDFKVCIYNETGDEILLFERAADMPAEIPLEPGQYYVTASSENNLPAAFSNPYYFGQSEMFSITAGSQQTVTVNCELANTMITIVYAENVRNNCTNYNTTVSSSAGSLLFVKDETRAGYFQPLPINISASLTWPIGNGTNETRILTGNIPSPQPKKHYEIHIDASLPGSAALLQIIVDETTDPVVIVPITDDNQPVVEGPVNSGALIITEIMANPDAILDTQGEYFEIFNTTNEPVDLQNMVIRKDDASTHIVEEQIILPSHAYFIFARSETATATEKYIYSSISLTNDEGVLALYNYGSDGTNGTLIFSLDYGDDSFPSVPSGASLILDPDLLNHIDAANGTSWCISSSVFSTGDQGTPGMQNDNCP